MFEDDGEDDHFVICDDSTDDVLGYFVTFRRSFRWVLAVGIDHLPCLLLAFIEERMVNCIKNRWFLFKKNKLKT